MELMNILKENCDPKKGNNAKLPYNAYLVQYVVGEESRWDLTMCHKRSDIFDYYYDKYKKVLAIVQSEGKVSPKLWRDPNELKEKPTPKKRK